MTQNLDAMPVVVELPVAWRDMDAFGHVNNTQYLRWFEDGRIAYFDAIDIAGAMKEHGVGPILASTSCRFRIPLTYPDTVRVGATVTALEDGRFTMRYVVWSVQHAGVAAEGEGQVVAFDYANGVKASWPASLRARIEELEGA